MSLYVWNIFENNKLKKKKNTQKPNSSYEKNMLPTEVRFYPGIHQNGFIF